MNGVNDDVEMCEVNNDYSQAKNFETNLENIYLKEENSALRSRVESLMKDNIFFKSEIGRLAVENSEMIQKLTLKSVSRKKWDFYHMNKSQILDKNKKISWREVKRQTDFLYERK